ncbi:MAG: MFS transporter [Myxococcota bacterium]
MSNAQPIPKRVLFGYGFIAAPVIYSYVLVLLMYMKYAAVSLGASTAAVGTVFLVAKLWDAVSDPMIGNASDRTQHRLGRRRPWIIAAAPLLALFSLMAWVPPESLEGTALIAWIAVAVIGFYTAYTMFDIPHMALGSEISLDSVGRNRIFGVRQVMRVLGMLVAATVGVHLVEQGRSSAALMAFAIAGITIGMILFGVSFLPKERPEFMGRGGENPVQALKDVVRNPHARLFLFVIFIDGIGTGGIGAMTPFVIDYVVGMKELTPVLLGSNMLATLAGVPLWLWLDRHFEKRRLILFSMFGSMIGYGLTLMVGEGDWHIIAISSVLAGLSSSCSNTLGYTLKSEIIDCDEHATGDRKEGAYFAGWSFVSKLSAGIMIGVVGWSLEWSGFDGAVQEQSDLAKRTMIILMGGFPLVCYFVGAIAFSRFSLTEAEHAEVREALDAAAESSPSSTSAAP